MAESTIPQDSWYYAIDGQQNGPIDAEQLRQLLRSRQLANDTLVWKAGMTDWKTAENISGLGVAPPPPPPSAAKTVRPPIPSGEQFYGQQLLTSAQRKRRIFFIIASGLAVICQVLI